jgi:hypothetical protein
MWISILSLIYFVAAASTCECFQVTSSVSFVSSNLSARGSPLQSARSCIGDEPPQLKDVEQNRRTALSVLIGGSLAFMSGPINANALDMDAFANRELENDKKNCDPKRDPKCAPAMTADEAMCKYGQSGEKRGEACKRVKEGGGSLNKGGSQGKSLGGAYAM